MTYIAQKPAISFTGIERPLITIEFAPNIHPSETEYQYEHPKFVFGDCITAKDEFPSIEYTVCALELIESKTPSGKLLNQPYWKYKVTDGQQTFWKEESALIRYNKHLPDTCSTCQYFNDYHDAYGKGWCELFDRNTKSHHTKTDDCFYSSQAEKSELDLPDSPYQVGSIVKVIDEHENHQQWAIFEIVECKYNPKLYQSAESYLNQTQWYYRLENVDGRIPYAPIWVMENEICHFDQSSNVCTEEVF